MLVITRKIGESVRIGENVIIKVVERKGEGIRLGIEAPAEVKIIRTELEKGGRRAGDEKQQVRD